MRQQPRAAAGGSIAAADGGPSLQLATANALATRAGEWFKMDNDVSIHLNGVEDSTSFVKVERTWSSRPPRRRLLLRRAAAQAAHIRAHTPDCRHRRQDDLHRRRSRHHHHHQPPGHPRRAALHAAGVGVRAAAALLRHLSAAGSEWLQMERNVCSCTSTAESDGASVVAGASVAGLGLSTTAAPPWCGGRDCCVLPPPPAAASMQRCVVRGRRHQHRGNRHRSSRGCHRERGTV